MKQVLMMGGVKDGVRVAVASNIYEIKAPVITEVPCMVGMDDISTAESLSYQNYFIHEFETDAGTLYLATENKHHQAHDLMAMLVDGYREKVGLMVMLANGYRDSGDAE